MSKTSEQAPQLCSLCLPFPNEFDLTALLIPNRAEIFCSNFLHQSISH
jgi:hypothetical protein